MLKISIKHKSPYKRITISKITDHPGIEPGTGVLSQHANHQAKAKKNCLLALTQPTPTSEQTQNVVFLFFFPPLF